MRNFLELNPGDRKRNWLASPVTLPFILFACLLWWESLLSLSRSAGLAVIFGPTAFFFLKSRINYNTVERPHYQPRKFCRWKSSWCVLQCCEDPLCMLSSGLSWGCHSLFVYPLATSLLGFHFRRNLLRSRSLCTACLFQQNTSLCQQGGCLNLGCQFERV